jgi:hypothetical protein
MRSTWKLPPAWPWSRSAREQTPGHPDGSRSLPADSSSSCNRSSPGRQVPLWRPKPRGGSALPLGHRRDAEGSFNTSGTIWAGAQGCSGGGVGHRSIIGPGYPGRLLWHRVDLQKSRSCSDIISPLAGAHRPATSSVPVAEQNRATMASRKRTDGSGNDHPRAPPFQVLRATQHRPGNGRRDRASCYHRTRPEPRRWLRPQAGRRRPWHPVPAPCWGATDDPVSIAPSCPNEIAAPPGGVALLLEVR